MGIFGGLGRPRSSARSAHARGTAVRVVCCRRRLRFRGVRRRQPPRRLSGDLRLRCAALRRGVGSLRPARAHAAWIRPLVDANRDGLPVRNRLRQGPATCLAAGQSHVRSDGIYSVERVGDRGKPVRGCRVGAGESRQEHGLMSNAKDWPSLPPATWQETYPTLHMWTQIVGKVCLKLTPLTNHFWNTAMHVTPRGLATPAIPYENRTFTMTFDFLAQRLAIECSDGAERSIRLEAQTVADFYRAVMHALHELGIEVRIWTVPSEVPNPIRFETDVTHAAYDPVAATSFWRMLNRIAPVMEKFRCKFIGKSSPVHFFWGSFDLAVTRFSGRKAPARNDPDPVLRKIMQEAYSHEV